MDNTNIHNINKNYWDNNADEWFGITALPTYGVQFVTEDELKLFGDVSGKKMLDIYILCMQLARLQTYKGHLLV